MIGFVPLYLVTLSSQVFAFEDSPLDCSVFKTEVEIFESFPFPVSIQPSNVSNDSNYALFGEGPVISQLYLFNKTSIPLAVFCLKNLQKLVIKSDNIIIPPEIGLLNSSLIHLEISLFSNRNNTTTTTTALNLPPEVFSLTRLGTLIVTGHNLETLSPAIGQLFRLTTLDLSYCGLETLPDTFERLGYLQTLKLMRNRLRSLPATMQRLTKLSTVDVSGNSLLNSLDALGGPRKIRYLNATNCAIEHLPLNINGLNVLDLSNNKLVTLSGVETLVATTGSEGYGKFWFSNNQIEFIPVTINQTKVFELRLDSNHLTTVPQEIFSSRELKALYVQDNPLSDKRREWITGLGSYSRVLVVV